MKKINVCLFDCTAVASFLKVVACIWVKRTIRVNFVSIINRTRSVSNSCEIVICLDVFPNSDTNKSKCTV